MDNFTLKALCEGCGESSCDEICCRYQDDDCVGCPLQEAFSRLAAYEDSGLSPEEVRVLQRENEALKQEKQDLFREILWLSRKEPDYVIRYDNDTDELGKRTIDDDYTYGPIWDGGENHER
jgi:hypothetical protein